MSAKTFKANLGVFLFLLSGFFVAYALGQTLTPFIAAAVFAYALNPLVRWMVERKVPRSLAASGFMLLFFAALFGVVALAAYIMQNEISQLIHNMPDYISRFEANYLPTIREKLGLGDQVDVRAIADRVKAELKSVSPESAKSAAAYAVKLVSGTVGFFLALFNVLLIPVIMLYLMIDFERIRPTIVKYLPVVYKDLILDKLREVEEVLRVFLKGQLLVAIILGVLYSIGLWFVGIDMPFIVGMGAGLLNLVPYLGGVVGIVVAVILAALKYHDLMHPGTVIAVFAAVQTLESYVLTPRIVGDKLGLHPVVVILALVVLGQLMGFTGVLLAVPIAAVLKVFIAGFLDDYKESSLYRPEEAGKG
jgi:predicted PurR-regulated permease PerM